MINNLLSILIWFPIFGGVLCVNMAHKLCFYRDSKILLINLDEQVSGDDEVLLNDLREQVREERNAQF